MKQNFKWILILGISLFMCLGIPSVAFADDPPCVGPDPMTGECPIDSGLLFLLLIGAAYGIKKVVDLRKGQATD